MGFHTPTTWINNPCQWLFALRGVKSGDRTGHRSGPLLPIQWLEKSVIQVEGLPNFDAVGSYLLWRIKYLIKTFLKHISPSRSRGSRKSFPTTGSLSQSTQFRLLYNMYYFDPSGFRHSLYSMLNMSQNQIKQYWADKLLTLSIYRLESGTCMFFINFFFLHVFYTPPRDLTYNPMTMGQVSVGGTNFGSKH